MATYKITFSKSGWTDGTDAIWYDTVQRSFFGDENLTQEVTAITPPSRECWRFNGFYNSASGTVQYVDDAGNFTDALLSLNITAAKTFYAQGTQVSWKLTLDDNKGADSDGCLYFRIGDGGYFDNHLCEGEPVSSVSKPSREGYAFAGYYNGTTTPGTQYINEDGSFMSSLDTLSLSNNKTIYARWVAPYKITVSANSGTGGTSAFYYDSVSGKFYAAADLAEEISAITPHTRECFAFVGCYSANNTTSTVRVAADGTIAADWTPTAAATIYSQWERQSWKITFNKSSGTDGTSALYYKISGGGYYADDLCTVSAQSITPPVRECYRFNGFYNSASGTTQYINADGEYTAALDSLSITSAKTFYAQWTRVSYKATLNDNGGSGGSGAFYFDGSTANFYADDQLTTPTTSVAVPTREGYNFLGYYASTSGGSRYVNESGAIVTLEVLTANLTIYARYQGHEYTLTFDYNGGTPGIVSKPVVFGAAIGTLPTPIRDRASFDGWYIGGFYLDGTIFGGEKITDSTIWNIADDTTATASWLRFFGSVIDFFGLASSALIPVASTTGDTRHRVAVSHGGKYESGVNEVSGIWRNPSVTYVVKADTTVSVQLGKGFAAQKSGSTMTVSGFMITTVEINTEVGKFPIVTVSAVANEGANAVNNFTVNANKFNVSVPVVARSKAQNLLGAISGGGHLQRCTLVATCDSVVCEENLMPCASDIVNGRYELAAETLAAENNAAPTTAGGFALINDPKETREIDYVRYTIEARKEMV